MTIATILFAAAVAPLASPGPVSAQQPAGTTAALVPTPVSAPAAKVLTLDEAIKICLASQPQLREAAAAVDASEARVGEARSGLLKVARQELALGLFEGERERQRAAPLPPASPSTAAPVRNKASAATFAVAAFAR